MKISLLFFAAILSLASFSAFAETININKANAATFAHYLNGVGEKKAKNIVAYRTQHKSFKNIEEIKNVKGIGEGIFKKIKADLSLTQGVTSVPVKMDKANNKIKALKKSEPAREKLKL